MAKLLFSLGVVFSSLGLGFVLQVLIRRGRITLPWPVVDLRRALQKIGLLGCMSVSFAGAVWSIQVDSLSVLSLPLVGLVALGLGGALGLGAARLLSLDRPQAGAMFCGGAFTNVGSIGSLVVLVYLGEAGLALVPLYKLLEELWYFGIAFPLARRYGPLAPTTQGWTEGFKTLVRDPFLLMALASVGLGGGLNLAHVPRPIWAEILTNLLAPLGTAIMLVSIGLAMRFTGLGRYLREIAAMIAIKHLATPLAAVGLAVLLGLDRTAGGLPLRVVLICSAMPVAFTALIPPSLFGLDLDLANASWLGTTLALVVVLPLLYWAVG